MEIQENVAEEGVYIVASQKANADAVCYKQGI